MPAAPDDPVLDLLHRHCARPGYYFAFDGDWASALRFTPDFRREDGAACPGLDAAGAESGDPLPRCGCCPMTDKSRCTGVASFAEAIAVFSGRASTDQVAVAWSQEGGRFQVFRTDLQTALAQAALVNAINFCDLSRRYADFFADLTPFLPTERLVRIVFRNILVACACDPARTRFETRRFVRVVHLSAENKLARLQRLVRNDALLNAVVKALTPFQLLEARVDDLLREALQDTVRSVLRPEELRSHLPALEAQHRALFQLLAALRLPAPGSDPSAALRRFRAEVARHFADEEALLARTSYRYLDFHRDEHAYFLSELDRLAAKPGGALPPGALDRINRWFEEHVQGSDADYLDMRED